MCKSPGCECQLVEPIYQNLQLLEENIGDEIEPIESEDSIYTESSSDEEGGEYSDTDTESGNRVTIDMVVSLMLKEEGLISEETYAKKPQQPVDDIRFLLPKIPKCTSECSLSSGNSDNRQSLDDMVDDFLAMHAKKENDKNNETVAKEAEEINHHDKKCNEGGDDCEENVAHEDSSKKTQVNTEVDLSCGDGMYVTQLQQPTTTTNVDLKECNEEVTNKLQEELESIETNEVGQKAKESLNTTDKTSSTEFNKDQEKQQLTKTLLEHGEDEEEESMAAFGGEDPETDSTKIKNTAESYNVDTNQCAGKITRSFKDILMTLVEEKRITDEYEYVDILKTYVKSLDKYYKNNKAVDLFNKHNEELKEFASFLNFFSPSSYKYITETFNTPLPSPKALCSWYLKDHDQPGLAKRAFKILKQKASKKRLTCVLMLRDIFMKNNGFNYDHVDYGGGCNDTYTEKAVMTYVFLLVSLDEDWKIPIGYIFARQVPAESQAELIRICLTQCYGSGADVVAVTLETPTPAEFLGCSFQDPKNLKTTFKHPECDREVAVWIDPCLAIRSARHTLKVKGVLHDDAGEKVRWSLIRKLRKLNYDELIEYRSSEFLKLRNHIAKVGLTTEILSESLSPALKLCEKLLPSMFKDSAPTRRYIETVNMLYDILNTRTITDIAEVEEHLNRAKEYMIALFSSDENKLSPFDKENLAPDKRLEYRSFVEGKPACGFIGFLICIESFKHLYATLIEKEQTLKHLKLYRLCKEHTENFVKSLRAYDHTTAEEFSGDNFQLFYDHLFDILEENPHFTDQSVSLEHWPIKNNYPPIKTIKLTAGKRAYDEVYSLQYCPKKMPKTSQEVQTTMLVREYSKAMDTEKDLLTRKHMVGYISGWIAAKFAKCLKCEACIDALCTDKKLWFHKLTQYHVKGVCLPSEEVFRICWECEQALRQSSPVKLRALVLKRLAARFPWASRQAAHHPIHHLQLARAVIAKYIPIRVPTPFSSKQKKKMRDMFRLFACMHDCGLFQELGGAPNDEDD